MNIMQGILPMAAAAGGTPGMLGMAGMAGMAGMGGMPGSIPGAMPGATPVAEDDALNSIPGAHMVKSVLEGYGIDGSMLVTIGILLTIFNSFTGLLSYFLNLLYEIADMFTTYCVSRASLTSHDESYTYVMEWFAQNYISTDSRTFDVETRSSIIVKKYQAMMFDGANFEDVNNGGELVQADSLGAKLKFIPQSINKKFFFFERTLFVAQRNIKHYVGPSNSRQTDEEELDIITIGRNPVKLRRFLAHCRVEYLKSLRHKTVIHTVDSYDMRWSPSVAKPLRDLDTVVMTAKDKKRLLEDVQDYLSPATKTWYAEQGLPYRRGYLFYGPPGTGKTSLATALAGALRCELFILTLSSQNMHDNYLIELFASLPPRAIILLEDVDSANVDRDQWGMNEEDVDSDDEEEIDKFLGSSRRRHSNVSLSGLLNAIDGVGSQEGRILIMTTNSYNLDPALIRPGRCDLKLEFPMAGKEVLEQIFIQLFKNNNKKSNDATSPKVNNDDSADPAIPLLTEKALSDEEWEIQRIHELAKKFADMLPENTFTPAEVQNFLLPRKRNPQRAVDELPIWLEEQLSNIKKKEAKEKKRRANLIRKRNRWRKQRQDMKEMDMASDRYGRDGGLGSISEDEEREKEEKDKEEENGEGSSSHEEGQEKEEEEGKGKKKTDSSEKKKRKEKNKEGGEEAAKETKKADDEKLKVNVEKASSADGDDWSDVDTSRTPPPSVLETPDTA